MKEILTDASVGITIIIMMVLLAVALKVTIFVMERWERFTKKS